MKLEPIGERVILKPVEAEEMTKSGIYLPKSEDKKEGIVSSVGTFKNGNPIPLAAGDHVMYSGYSNEDVEIEGQKYLIVEYKDIVAKLMKDSLNDIKITPDNKQEFIGKDNKWENN